MPELPRTVTNVLMAAVYDERSAAWLEIDADLVLVDAGGHLEDYGLGRMRLGEPATTQAVFLEGLIPVDGEPCTVPSAEISDGRAVDIHFVFENGRLWVLLLDVTEARNTAQRMRSEE